VVISFVEIKRKERGWLDVHGSVRRNIKLIERTNKKQPCSRIYYSDVS